MGTSSTSGTAADGPGPEDRDPARAGGAPPFAVLSVALGLFVVASTEFLSSFRAFRAPFVPGLWALAAAGLLVLAARTAFRLRGPEPVPGRWRTPEAPAWAATAAILAATAVVAVASPPNNWDSMSYHMARVAHWLQEGSVSHFPTSIDRQLLMPPFAEYAIANLQILASGDRAANLVQWAAFAGSAALSASIAGRLGAARFGRALAALLVVSLPIGILEATSTQTDLVAAFWVLVTLRLALEIVPGRPGPGPGTRPDGPALAAALGAAAGLAFLTKQTALFTVGPLGAWLAVDALARRDRRRAGLLAVALATAAALQVPTAVRNFETYGHPAGPVRMLRLGWNELPAVQAAASGLLRNAAIHVSLPVPRIERAAESVVVAAHRFLGLDPSDPRSTYLGARFAVGPFRIHEDLSGNLLHALLLSGLAVPLMLRSRERPLRALALVLVAGVVLFSAALRWQPWGSRLQLPFFLLAAPAAAVVLERTLGPRLGTGLVAVLAAGSVPFLALNATRPLRPGPDSVLARPRIEATFAGRPSFGASFRALASRLAADPPSSLGLVLSEDDWEYPYWAFVAGRDGRAPRIEHVVARGVRSGRAVDPIGFGSARLDSSPTFRPEVVVWDATWRPLPPGGECDVHGRRYRLVASFGPLHLFRPGAGEST